MPDLSQVIRWNAGFVRGLAQSVLERARVIRGSLSPSDGSVATKFAKPKAKSGGRRIKVQRVTKRKPKK